MTPPPLQALFSTARTSPLQFRAVDFPERHISTNVYSIGRYPRPCRFSSFLDPPANPLSPLSFSFLKKVLWDLRVVDPLFNASPFSAQKKHCGGGHSLKNLQPTTSPPPPSPGRSVFPLHLRHQPNQARQVLDTFWYVLDLPAKPN